MQQEFIAEVESQLNTTLSSKDKIVSHLYETFNYDKFEFIETNRNIDENLVDQIKLSMQEDDFLITPILVCQMIIGGKNKLGIIDGQHTFKASSQLGLPIYYIIIHSDDVEKDMIIRNSIKKKWNGDDYTVHYVKEGKPDYIVADNFQKEFPVIKLPLALKLLSNFQAGTPTKTHKLANGKVIRGKDGYRRGKFKVIDIENETERENRGLWFTDLVKLVKMKSAVSTVLIQIYECKDIDNYVFLNKVEEAGKRMKDRTDSKGRLLLPDGHNRIIDEFEDMYNFRRFSGNRINFRDVLKKKPGKP